MQGWIKIHRRIVKKGFYKNSSYVHLWVHLLLLAGYEQHEFLWNGSILKLKPGQFVTGRRQLTKETRIPSTTVERILDLFEKEGQIGQQKTNKWRLITIVNWDKHQMIGPQTDHKRTTDGHNQELQEGKEDTAQARVTSKKMKNYDESASSDSHDKVVDMETGEIAGAKKKPETKKAMDDLLHWAEDRRGRRFLTPLKQYRAMSEMKKAGISVDVIQDRWLRMEKDAFFKEKGFDFMTVLSSLDKK